MNDRAAAPAISSEADLLAQIDYSGPTAIEDWLNEWCELADQFDGGGREDAFERVLFFVGFTGLHANYTIELAGGAPRLHFENCTFEAQLGASGGSSSR